MATISLPTAPVKLSTTHSASIKISYCQ